MKIAVTAQEGRIDAQVDSRFGRAPFFMIADSETMDVYAYDNSAGFSAGNGAGTSAAQLMAEQSVDALYTGKVGPKAAEALKKAGVKVKEETTGTVEEVLTTALQNIVTAQTDEPQTELEIPPSKPVAPGAIRVAIPSDSDAGMTAPRSGHFGKCAYYTLVDIAEKDVVSVQSMRNGGHVVGGCSVPVRLLKGWDVNKVMVAGIGGRPLTGFQNEGIHVYSGHGDTVQETVNAYLQGQLGPIQQDQVCGGGA